MLKQILNKVGFSVRFVGNLGKVLDKLEFELYTPSN
jgi:hypothetical protein